MEATAKNTSAPHGAIDLGSNSFRLLIANVDGHKITTLAKELRTVRLAGGLTNSGVLSPDGTRTGLNVLLGFRSLLDMHAVSKCACYGTEALRRANDSEKFIQTARSILGCDIKILTGTREAELSASGVLAGMHSLISLPALIVDVGGGSTEISYIFKDGKILRSQSLPAGAVSLSECSAQYSADISKDLIIRLKDFLSEIPDYQSAQLVSTGGTATTIAMLDLNLARYDEQKIHGHNVLSAHLDILSKRLSGLNVADRNLIPGLEDGRGEIIVAGCKIYQEIIATIGVGGMIVSDWGLLEGILLEGAN